MYRQNRKTQQTMKGVKVYEGESIEKKLERMLNNKEPIKDQANQIIYQNRADGVAPQYNPRADRWELATEAKSKLDAREIAKRENQQKFSKELEKANEGKPNDLKDTGGESIRTT